MGTFTVASAQCLAAAATERGSMAACAVISLYPLSMSSAAPRMASETPSAAAESTSGTHFTLSANARPRAEMFWTARVQAAWTALMSRDMKLRQVCTLAEPRRRAR